MLTVGPVGTLRIHSGPPAVTPQRPVRASASYAAPVLPWEEGPGVVELSDGRRIRGRSLRKRRAEDQEPAFGVYLLGHDPGPFAWEHRWVRWPDFRVPPSTESAAGALREAYERAAGERVEVACRSGIGRTGTALAVIAILGGVPPAEAVTWVRQRYHSRAAETPRQRRWVVQTDL